MRRMPPRPLRALALALVLVAGWPASRAAGQQARPPLPVAPAAQEQGELPAALRDLLRAYAEELPDARRLQWRPANEPFGSMRTESWSPARDRFREACNKDGGACKKLLLAQLDTLIPAVQAKARQDVSEWTASGLSAISDFCTVTRDVARCGLNNLADIAAGAWMVLGRDALFVAYLARFDSERNTFLRPAQARGEQVPDHVKREFRDTPPLWEARRYEALGQLDVARTMWTQAFTKTTDRQQQRYIMWQVARLEWRLANEEQARGWEALLAEMPPTTDDKQALCVGRHEQWRTAIARAQAVHEPVPAPLEALRALMKDDCPFSRGLQEYATDVLTGSPQPAQLAELRAMLDAGINVCRTNCFPLRLQALQDLRSVADPAPAAAATVARKQKDDLERLARAADDGDRLDDDLQVAWAAANTLYRQDRASADAGTLVDALLARRQAGADVDRSTSAEVQANRARYDGLYRLGAASAAARGTTADLRTLEGMRGQSLLRRLRQSAYEQRLANVHDAKAEADLRRMTSEVEQARARLRELGARAPGAAWLVAAQERLLDDAMDTFRVQYLEALAARLLDGNDEQKKLARAYTGSSALWELDTWGDGADRRANPLDSLAPDEAYVSWLRVPGGFIAATARYDAAYYPPYPRDLNLRGGHRRRDLFIPLSPAQEATVSLYRELLLTGGAAKRGATVAQDAVLRDASGLRLRGVPVWRLQDGTFTTADKAPAGAARAQELREIGREIFGWLLEPVRADWQGAKRLVLSPDGVLTLLPFETLWAGDRPLLDLVDVSYVQTLEVHAELKRRAEQRRSDGRRALSIAAPDFTAPSAATGPRDWRTSVHWQPLPGTLEESKALQAVFPGMRQLVGKDARRAGVLQLNAKQQLKDFSVLHFATHGYVDDQRSALVLSMADGVQQAYLVDSDVAGLDLRSELVLLSACDTGVGRQQRGEGVVGLPYAFMLAGNINTLMSLWPVDDAGTAAFMPVFLKKARDGKDVVTALNETKREFAAGQHGERNRDPRIWAAFVQYGVPLKL